MRKPKRQKCGEKKKNWRRKLTCYRQIDTECNNAYEMLAINIQLEQTTTELEKIIEYKTKGAIMRAK